MRTLFTVILITLASHTGAEEKKYFHKEVSDIEVLLVLKEGAKLSDFELSEFFNIQIFLFDDKLYRCKFGSQTDFVVKCTVRYNCAEINEDNSDLKDFFHCAGVPPLRIGDQ